MNNIIYSTNAPTKEELAKRQRKYNRLIKLGIDPTLVVDDTDTQI